MAQLGRTTSLSDGMGRRDGDADCVPAGVPRQCCLRLMRMAMRTAAVMAARPPVSAVMMAISIATGEHFGAVDHRTGDHGDEDGGCDDSQDAEATADRRGSRKACTSAATSRTREWRMMLAWDVRPILLAWNMPRTPLSVKLRWDRVGGGPGRGMRVLQARRAVPVRTADLSVLTRTDVGAVSRDRCSAATSMQSRDSVATLADCRPASTGSVPLLPS